MCLHVPTSDSPLDVINQWLPVMNVIVGYFCMWYVTKWLHHRLSLCCAWLGLPIPKNDIHHQFTTYWWHPSKNHVNLIAVRHIWPFHTLSVMYPWHSTSRFWNYYCFGPGTSLVVKLYVIIIILLYSWEAESVGSHLCHHTLFPHVIYILTPVARATLILLNPCQKTWILWTNDW